MIDVTDACLKYYMICYIVWWCNNKCLSQEDDFYQSAIAVSAGSQFATVSNQEEDNLACHWKKRFLHCFRAKFYTG